MQIGDEVTIGSGKYAGETGFVVEDLGSQARVDVRGHVFTYSIESLRILSEPTEECIHQARCQQRWRVSLKYVCRWREHGNTEDCGLKKQFERGLLDEGDHAAPTPDAEFAVGDMVTLRRGKHAGKVGEVVEVKDDYVPTRYLVAIKLNGLTQKFTYTGRAIKKKGA